MPSPLVECIPNFSEARRPEVVEAIVQTLQAVPGIHLLDRHSDTDHNRTVLTFIGRPDSVSEAAFQAIRKASELIDLNHHTGEHPRIGATDVVPFVPINDITMPECVELARKLGHRVGDELHIPVYLYEEAATRPERQNLENIRKGQYEGLKTEIETDPNRAPDFGPAHLGSAGATVIGARHPLIAFNVYLTTDDISIAQKIAKAVRNSSGGMHYVKALGLLVDGRAQVSMNLTNYRQSPIGRVVEFIRREAQRYGVSIHHSELVGLTPQEALIDASTWYLQLDGFTPDQILERRLYEGQGAQKPEITPSAADEFVSALAAGTPTPGGGSASAYAGSMAAALISMVARLTIGKKKYADVQPQMAALLEKAEAKRAEMTLGVTCDAEAFTKVMDAIHLPKDSPEQAETRKNALEAAMITAAGVPLETARIALEIMQLAIQAAALGNKSAISDAGTASAMARACLRGAGYNVRINCGSIQNREIANQYLTEIKALEQSAEKLESEMEQTLSQRGEMSL
jgi:glutamate formiminotransferase/formiminotetrahydrofolate cyclodeaminase